MQYINFIKKIIVFKCIALASLGAGAGAFDDFFTAIKRDHESAVVALALRGFDLNTVDASGNHGLLLAIREGSPNVARFLVEQPSVQVETRNHNGESPLMMAALKGDLAMAKRLIERKAEVNKPGWAPLHYAATLSEPISTAMVRLMLDHHAYIDAESPNRTTPLMMAAQYGLPQVVKMLLEEGADPMLQNEQGLSAIDFARLGNRKDSVDLIASFVRARQATGTW